MAAVFSEDPRYTYAGGERGGWYQTANRDAFVRHPNEKRAHARHFAGAGTASTVRERERERESERDHMTI
jgi:hypothetical protein